MVGPLSHSYAAAGFFPKSTDPKLAEIDNNNDNIQLKASTAEANCDSEDEAEATTQQGGQNSNNNNDNNNNNNIITYSDDNQEESVYEQSKYWLIEDSNVSRLNKQFLRCTQTLNLRNNFLYWDCKSKEKQHQLQQQTSISSRKHSLVDANNNNTDSEIQTEKEP